MLNSKKEILVKKINYFSQCLHVSLCSKLSIAAFNLLFSSITHPTQVLNPSISINSFPHMLQLENKFPPSNPNDISSVGKSWCNSSGAGTVVGISSVGISSAFGISSVGILSAFGFSPVWISKGLQTLFWPSVSNGLQTYKIGRC